MHSHRFAEASQQQPLKGILVLLVEDELDIADLLLIVLQAAGASVRLCNEAEAALVLLETLQPHILLSNIQLPSHNGIWLIQQIRNHPRSEIQRLCAIGVTSYHRDVHAADALEAGFDRFLSKLESPDAIVNTISELVASPLH